MTREGNTTTRSKSESLLLPPPLKCLTVEQRLLLFWFHIFSFPDTGWSRRNDYNGQANASLRDGFETKGPEKKKTRDDAPGEKVQTALATQQRHPFLVFEAKRRPHFLEDEPKACTRSPKILV